PSLALGSAGRHRGGTPMQITGSYTFAAPREAVWRSMLSADAISHCMPGCEDFKTLGEDSYEATMRVGVGSRRGTFNGKIKLLERNEPTSYRMDVEGGGRPGRVKG